MKFEIFDAEPWPEDQLVPLEVSKGSLDSSERPSSAPQLRKQIVTLASRLHSSPHRRRRKLPRRQLAATLCQTMPLYAGF